LEAKLLVINKQTKNNLENGKEYAGLIKTLYQNLMLDKRVLKTEKDLHGTCYSDMKYGFGVFRKGIVTYDNFHEEICS